MRSERSLEYREPRVSSRLEVVLRPEESGEYLDPRESLLRRGSSRSQRGERSARGRLVWPSAESGRAERLGALFGPSGWPRWWAFLGALRASVFWAAVQRAFFGPDAFLGMGVFTCVSSSVRT